jgi:hypothetical protein
MRKTYLLLAAMFAMFTSNAQTTIEVDPCAGVDGDAWFGFMNVFELDETTFVFNSGWGVGDLKSTVNCADGRITLQPNFNTYAENPDDPFWVNQTTGEGAKFMRANTIVGDNSGLGGEQTFTGGVESYTLSSEYSVVAFIRVFNADFSALLREMTLPITEAGVFSMTMTETDAADGQVQFGFEVSGPNANPADEGTLGSVVVGPVALNVNDAEIIGLSAYPNPASDVLNVQTRTEQTGIAIYNVLGQQVLTQKLTGTNSAINVAGLKTGVYFATVTTDAGQQQIKIVKR